MERMRSESEQPGLSPSFSPCTIEPLMPSPHPRDAGLVCGGSQALMSYKSVPGDAEVPSGLCNHPGEILFWKREARDIPSKGWIVPISQPGKQVLRNILPYMPRASRQNYKDE